MRINIIIIFQNTLLYFEIINDNIIKITIKHNETLLNITIRFHFKIVGT
jgi:hypothetical protein